MQNRKFKILLGCTLLNMEMHIGETYKVMVRNGCGYICSCFGTAYARDQGLLVQSPAETAMLKSPNVCVVHLW